MTIRWAAPRTRVWFVASILALVAACAEEEPFADAQVAAEPRDNPVLDRAEPTPLERVTREQRTLPRPPATDAAPTLQREAAQLTNQWLKRADKHAGRALSSNEVRIAYLACELETGRVLCSRATTESLRPASNLKLMTTAAALLAFGPDGEIVTEVEGTTAIERGVLNGDLVIRGAGDPLWRPEAHGADILTELARELARMRLTRVTGDLVLDVTGFDDPGPGPAWPDASQHWDDYCALSGAFSVNGGVLETWVTPRASGQKAGVVVRPWPTGLESRFDVLTKRGSKVRVNVGATPQRVTVKGSLPPGKRPFWADFRHPDPVQLFGHVLEDRLRAMGVKVDGKLMQARGTPAGVKLAAMRSPVVELLPPINRDSVNGVADQLFFALGEYLLDDGSRAGASKAVHEVLKAFGVDPKGCVQVDGSGLSRDNRVTVEHLVTLLRGVFAGDPGVARLYRNSLAIGGMTGTLDDRLRGASTKGRVYAKTGWIGGTSALSGLTETMSGQQVVFSILVSYPRKIAGMNSSVFKPFQDELVTLLAEKTP